MQYLPSHLRSLSGFNPNGPGIFGCFVISLWAMLLWSYFSDCLHFLHYFFLQLYSSSSFYAGKQIANPLGFLRSAQNWLHFFHAGRIRLALKPSASEESYFALCTAQVTQALLSALRKAVPEKSKALAKKTFSYPLCYNDEAQDTGKLIYFFPTCYLLSGTKTQSCIMSYCLCFALLWIPSKPTEWLIDYECMVIIHIICIAYFSPCLSFLPLIFTSSGGSR